MTKEDHLLSSYDYLLQDNVIAHFPIEPRHDSRLMMVEKENESLLEARHEKVWDLQNELLPGDLLILNNTKVIRARLKVRRSSGGMSELFLLEPREEGRWLCLAKPAKKILPDDLLELVALNQESIKLKVVSKDKETGGRIVQFPQKYFNFEKIETLLNKYGEVPLPPYIESKNFIDGDRYQTRYASSPGAVAAPTAGLHLSDELIEILSSKGVKKTFVTLHVGIGTFRPIEQEDLMNLKLHKEWVEVSKEVINDIEQCRIQGGRIIAIGTTSVRAIEGSIAANKGKLKPFQGNVDLVIKPGYRFKVVDGLLTNFHLPKSSLLLLVSALIGRERLLALYTDAMQRKYRFFSYGDAMWIPPKVVLPEARSDLFSFNYLDLE